MPGNNLVRREKGLSLIELLVAMALSTLLILGLIEIFGSTRGAFASSQALARVQESSRFGLEMLRRDLRMAGQFGCLNEFAHIDVGSSDPRFFHHFLTDGEEEIDAVYPLRADNPLEVYEYAGTSPTDDFEIAEGAPTAAPGAASYTPQIPADLWARIGGNAVAGSDVVVARYAEEYPLTLRQYLTGNGHIHIDAADTARASLFAPYVLTNCKQASLFQITAGPSPQVFRSDQGLNRQRDGVYWHNKEVYGVGSLLSRYRYSAYYVGDNGRGATSLYRVGLEESPANANEGVRLDDREEVVEGVEMLQALVGLVNAGPYTTANPREDNVLAYSSIADLVAGFTDDADLRARLQRIISVRVSLLVRSPEIGAAAPPAVPEMMIGDVEVTLPPDRHMRHVYDSTVAIRNRVRN